MENKIKLTIGIPVYNGERFIGKALDSILNQIDASNKNQIEIVISDNDSRDNTASIIESYLVENEKLIKYYGNNENYGYDKNIDLLVERASGEYVWFLGCGEIIKNGSINLILDEILKDTYDNILLNFDIYSEDLGKIEIENNFNIYGDEVFSEKNEFWRKTKTGVTPISANIVKKDVYSQIKSNPLIEIGWVHVERIIDIVARNEYQKSLWVAKPCFTLYRENDGWWTKNGNLLLNSLKLFNILNSMKNKRYDMERLSFIEKDFKLKNFFNYTVIAKKQNFQFDTKTISNLNFIFSRNIFYWILLFPIIFIPNKVLIKTFNVIKMFKKGLRKCRQ